MARFGILLLIATCFFACEPPPAGPPQLPLGVLDKRLFSAGRGFYYQKTYTEVPHNIDYTKVPVHAAAPISPLRKIRFELQENWLVAYRWGDGFTAEVDGADLASVAQPELMFPVQHVDVFQNQAAVTPSRPWYQRSHVIVDWSYPTLESTGYVEVPLSALRPERFWVSDPADRDAPLFSSGYLDVTVRATVHFDYLTTYGYGSDLNCFDRDNPNCTGGRLSYRLSFMEVPESDYQALPVLDVLSVNTFPVFKVAQRHYSDQYAFTDGATTSLAMRFHVYRRSRADDGTLIPERDREVRQQPVFLSRSWPAELVGAVESNLALWNGALRDALNSRRRYECQQSGCAPQLVDGWEFFVLCPHNPVEPGDPEVCGPEGTAARLGDVRYLLFEWATSVGLAAPIATAYWAADPQTGELRGGLLNVNASALDRQAMTMVDALRLLEGTPAFARDYGAGRATDDWVSAMAGRRVGEPIPTANALSSVATRPPPSRAAAPAPAPPAASIDWSWLFDAAAPSGRVDPRTLGGLWPGRATRATERLAAEAATGAQRRKRLAGTAWEDALLSPDWLGHVGEAPFEPLAPERRPEVSPLGDWAWWRRASRPTDTFAADTFFFDANIAEVAPEYAGLSDLEVYERVRREQVELVVAHEVGHLLALRHNFGGSYDAFNYPDAYWRLRNDGSAGPRYGDPLTATERAGGIHRLQSASVMDYAPNPSVWNRDLGRYDRAVIKWLYGGMVEVMDGATNRTNAASLNELTFWHRFYAPTPSIAAPDGSKRSLHYTDLPRFFELGNRADFPVEQLVNFYRNPETIPGSGANATPDGRVMAPWRICGDDAPPVTGCGQQDVGADPFEVVTDVLARERGYYLYTHFRRGFVGFPKLRRASLSGLARGAESALLLSATVTGLLFNDPAYFVAGEGFEVYSRALAAGLDGIGERLSMPDVGSYALRPNADGVMLYQSDSAGPLRLDQDAARFYASQVLTPSDNSHAYLRELSRLGWAGDKDSAIDLLTYGPSVAGLAGVNEVRSPRNSVAGYYKFFPGQVNGLLGALLTDDVQRFAPAWDGAQLSRPRISDPAWSAGGLPQVDPMVPLSVKLRAVTVGYPSLFAASTTRAFADLARIWVQGSGAGVVSPNTVSWFDARSGKTYQALSFLSGAVETGIGAQLLARAQRLEQRAATAPTPAERALAAEALEDLRYLIEYSRLVIEAVEGGGGAP